MKNIAGLIVPVLMILVGIYVLFTVLGSSSAQVSLLGAAVLPRGLAIALGLISVGGGGVVLLTALSNRKLTSS
ncbi:MAG TPA: hypothetical protein VKK81_05085 [Candidatus Binatia bacterium]|nr:hypothetical protein [Candidatus Binatia bacterium]